MAKIAYLGPEKTFTEQAAMEIFPFGELISFQPIRRVIKAVENEEADYGVVPIENFYNGDVRETLDSLTECFKTKVISEKAMKIVHCLGALPNHAAIKQILSKDQALEQCSRYICENYPDASTISASSTAEAVKKIRDENLLYVAAIASETALKEGGLEILARDICPNNKTRFIVLGREKTKPTGDDKTFLAIHPPVRDRPGVLHDFLGFIAGLGINLEYIQSRPDGKRGYYFYIELDGHASEEKIQTAIKGIKLSLDPEKEYSDTIKILGSYSNSNWKNED